MAVSDTNLCKNGHPGTAVPLLDMLDKHRQPSGSSNTFHVKAALREASEENSWSNRTFNNNKTALFTLFLFLQSEKIISDVPTEKIEKKKMKSKKHRYYDPEQFKRVREGILA